MAVYHFFELVMVLHQEDDLKASEKLKEDVVHDLWDAALAIECLECPNLDLKRFKAQHQGLSRASCVPFPGAPCGCRDPYWRR